MVEMLNNSVLKCVQYLRTSEPPEQPTALTVTASSMFSNDRTHKLSTAVIKRFLIQEQSSNGGNDKQRCMTCELTTVPFRYHEPI